MKIREPRLYYDLQNPNYSIYHRAALAGLASTIKAWGRETPADIRCKVTDSAVSITWPDSLSDAEALQRILSWSFRISDDKLIDMPGHRFGKRQDLRALTHFCLMETFLQHPLTRNCENELRTMQIDMGRKELPLYVQYKAVTKYAHQDARGTKIFSPEHHGKFPQFAKIIQPMIPGVLASGHSLRCSTQDTILLLFTCVGSQLFILRPLKSTETQSFGIVIPEVTNLLEFCSEQKRLSSSAPFKSFYTNSFEGRVVGTIEEAALKLALDKTRISNDVPPRSRGIIMDNVPWDAYQHYRTDAQTFDVSNVSLTQFDKISETFRRCVNLMDSNFHTFLFPASFLPSLIAKNCLEHRAWYHGLDRQVEFADSFEDMLSSHAAFRLLINSCSRDERDAINLFHQSWLSILRKHAATGKSLDMHWIHQTTSFTMHSFMRLRSHRQLINWFIEFIETNSNERDSGPARIKSEGLHHQKSKSHSRRVEYLRICKLWNDEIAFEDLRSLLLVALITAAKTIRSY